MSTLLEDVQTCVLFNAWDTHEIATNGRGLMGARAQGRAIAIFNILRNLLYKFSVFYMVYHILINSHTLYITLHI